MPKVILEYNNFSVISIDGKFYSVEQGEPMKQLELVERVQLNFDDKDPSEEDLLDGKVNGKHVEYDFAGEVNMYESEEAEYLYFVIKED